MDFKPEYSIEATTDQPEINFSQMVIDLNTLAQTLSIAVNMRFMSPEHAKKVWRKWLTDSQLDVVEKGGETRGAIEEN